MKRFFVVVLPVALGCALNPPPIPVTGAAPDVSALSGEWTGEYRSTEAGRWGSISFKLTAGRDTAFGDVIMIPRETQNWNREPARPAAPLPPQPQVLTINFVRVEGDFVSGQLIPYPSPDCDCQLLTTFRGHLKGDRLEGDFWIQHSGKEMAPQRGTWWVKRVKTD